MKNILLIVALTLVGFVSTTSAQTNAASPQRPPREVRTSVFESDFATVTRELSKLSKKLAEDAAYARRFRGAAKERDKKNLERVIREAGVSESFTTEVSGGSQGGPSEIKITIHIKVGKVDITIVIEI